MLSSPLGASPRYLVWESGPVNAGAVPTLLVQREVPTGRIRTLARTPDPSYGIATTRNWVVYVADRSSPTLLAVHHDGSGRRVLGTNLATAIASRGERVAWAEQSNQLQRIYVDDLVTGRKWLAARLPRCVQKRCYRVDAITLADRGVVFTRGAIGPQPSYVVRRAFDGKLVSFALPGDPQPDLAASSDGALYFYFGHGWYRWDFGHARPTPARIPTSATTSVLAFDHGNWYLRTDPGCRPTLSVIRPDGRRAVLTSPRTASKLIGAPPSDCAHLTDLAIAGTELFTGWTSQPSYSINSHVDLGLVGAILAQRNQG